MAPGFRIDTHETSRLPTPRSPLKCRLQQSETCRVILFAYSWRDDIHNSTVQVEEMSFTQEPDSHIVFWQTSTLVCRYPNTAALTSLGVVQYYKVPPRIIQSFWDASPWLFGHRRLCVYGCHACLLLSEYSHTTKRHSIGSTTYGNTESSIKIKLSIICRKGAPPTSNVGKVPRSKLCARHTSIQMVIYCPRTV
jgi:hypothetical protein